MNDDHILLLENIHPNAVEVLQQAGFNRVSLVKEAYEGEELRAALAEVTALGIRSRTQLTAEVLSAAPKLKTIGCFCIGTNQVDLSAAQRCGIPVFNAPYSNTRSVAELVIGEIIALLRDLVGKNAAVHAGRWPKKAQGAFEARGKILGIVGYGNIGAQLSVLAESIGMRVCYYDIAAKLPLGNAEPVASLEALLRQSDVVSLHVPQTEATRQLIGARELKLMKKGALLINAARGHCVDIEALAQALKSEQLGGAAIDVFPSEPKTTDEALNSPLRGLEHVILTPHIGGSTVEAQANIGREVAEKFIHFLRDGTTTSAVNFPEISLPKQSERHRLLHIHRNQPGVLSAVNALFAHNHINIAAQSLMTRGEVGYLLMDVDRSHAQVALEKLKEISGTIRARLLY